MNDEQLFSINDQQWQRKEIELNSFTLSCLEGGCSTGKTILFLHGWNVSTEPYSDCLNSLAEKYWIIAPDLPGFGRCLRLASQSPCSLSLSSYQTYANCIIQLIQLLDLAKFHLVGHSFGGGIALALAAAIPDKVISVIAIDSTGIPLISPAEIVRRRFAELPQQIAQLRWQPFIRILLAALYNGIFRRQYLIEGAKISLREDLRPWLKDIKSPCLVLWGERDYFTDLDLGYGLVEAIADSQLQIVPNGYHEWCMMQPEKLAAISCDFFKRIEIESSTPNSYEASKT